MQSILKGSERLKIAWETDGQFRLIPPELHKKSRRHCSDAMGAALSAPVDELPLAVAAVAEITQFDLEQLRTLRAVCHGGEVCYISEGQNGVSEEQEHAVDAHVDLEHPADLTWATFLRALDAANFSAPDRAILERMFTLMDRTGDDVVSCRELLVGACLLLQGDLADKLQAAVEIHRISASDERARRASFAAANLGLCPSHEALVFVLSTFAMVASFFGDPLMKKTEIVKLVSEVLPNDSHESVDLLISRLAHHPTLERYIHQLEVGADHHE